MPKPKILISMLTDEDTIQAEFGQAVMQPLFSKDLLRPEFASNYEPINKPIDKEQDTIPFWSGNPFLCLRKRNIASQVSVFHTGNFGSGAIIFNAAYTPDFDWMNLFREWLFTSKAHYGYLHLITDYERDNSELPSEAAYSFFLGAFSKAVERGIPGLAWANYFSPRWSGIDFGYLKRHNLEVEPMLGGHILSLTSNIDHVLNDYNTFSESRRLARPGFREGFFSRR